MFQLDRLQKMVDREGELRVDLAKQEKDASDSGDAITRTKVALKISQCDNRTQALALLTLHFFTALQICDESNCDKNKVEMFLTLVIEY